MRVYESTSFGCPVGTLTKLPNADVIYEVELPEGIRAEDWGVWLSRGRITHWSVALHEASLGMNGIKILSKFVR